MQPQLTITNAKVEAVFDSYPDKIRNALFDLRQLIYDVVTENPEIGDIEETLKWGQISYHPKKKNIGTTVRIAQQKDNETGYALFVPCSTSLLDSYRRMYPETFEYEGDRAILLSTEEDLPVEALKHCIELALTYHLRK